MKGEGKLVPPSLPPKLGRTLYRVFWESHGEWGHIQRSLEALTSICIARNLGAVLRASGAGRYSRCKTAAVKCSRAQTGSQQTSCCPAQSSHCPQPTSPQASSDSCHKAHIQTTEKKHISCETLLG